MARPLRIELAGSLYPVTSRGDRREAIYRDKQDRDNWLAVLAFAHGYDAGDAALAGLVGGLIGATAGRCRPCPPGGSRALLHAGARRHRALRPVSGL